MSRVWIDLHNHVIPGVDDGAQNVADALAAVRALGDDGVRCVVATPHFDGSLTHRPNAMATRLEELDRGWSTLREAWQGEGLELRRGAEIKLDVPEVDLSDERLRLGGGPAVLVEFPFMSVPPRSAAVLSGIRRQGYVPVLAHPERYQGLDASLETVRSWLDAGGVLQVNAASLLGRYGSTPQAAATELLRRGWVTCLGSDYHGYRAPRLAEARALVEGWDGLEEAIQLFEENPGRLLSGEATVAVRPLERPGSFGRLLRKLVPW